MKRKILFIGFNDSSFCLNDEKILKKEFEVVPLYIPTNESKSLLALPFKILSRIRGCDVVYIWFGSIHATIAVSIAKMLGKKTIIVAGGYDTANEPGIGYGLMSKRFLRYAPILAFGHCDRILAVSEFIKKEAISITDDADKIVVIPNAIDVEEFRETGSVAKRTTITTMGNVTPRSFVVKGIDKFVDLARDTPDQMFTLIGRTDLGVDIEMLPNLEKAGYKVGEDLVAILNGSKYYLQLSYRESFGVAVIEAMACGCIPIVTNRGALPEVVGDTGYIVDYGDMKRLSQIIQNDYDQELGKKASERVRRLFDMRTREVAVISEINKLL